MVFIIYVAALLARDVARREDVSAHLWVVVCWVAIIGSRPVSSWFGHGAIELSGSVEAYDEGNLVDRLSYFLLIFYAGAILLYRHTRFSDFVGANRVLIIFSLYCAASVLWADLPFVAFKRWIKEFGNILMVLVVLTERSPIEAMKAVFVRCAAIVVPLSVLLIRFYGDLGRTYHVASGEMMYTGITTHKNSLGLLALVCSMFLLWDYATSLTDRTRRRGKVGVLLDVSLLLMSSMLLVQANSATALVCGVVGATVFVALSIERVRRNILRYEMAVVLLVLLIWAVNSTYDVARFVVVDLLERDLTLTTRTDVWPMLLALSDDMMLGAGFNSFWTGGRLELVYGQLGIIQAHNGYLEAYLNGGLVGVALLMLLIATSAMSINHDVIRDEALSRVKLAILLIAIVGNLTEASFSKMNIVWFVFLLIISRYPNTKPLVRRPNEGLGRLSRSRTYRRYQPTLSGDAGVRQPHRE